MAFLDDLAKYQAAEAAKYQTGFQDYLMQGQPSAPTFDQGDSFSQYLIDLNSFVPRDVGQVGLDKGLQSYQSLFAGFPLNDAQKAAVAQNNAQKISPYMQSLGFNNPVDWFASVGDNRNALYGAYGAATPNPQTSTDSEGNAVSNPYSWEMDLGFGNRQAMPNLQAYSGQQLVFDDWFENKYAGQSSQEAQQILKQFFPNIPQSQLDQAAYSAIQKQGYMPYWGAGPIPTVRLIADELGVANPSLSAWMDANQDAYSKRYQSYRDQVHSAEDADSMSQNMASISGLASVFGPAIGGMMGYGPFGGAGSAGSTAGGSSMFGDIGDFFSNLFSGGSSSPSGWDFGPLSDSFLGGGLDPVSGMNLGSMGVNPTGWDFGPLSDSLLSGGVDPVSGMSLSQMNPSFIDSLIKQATKDPLGSASKVLKSLTGSEQPADWAKLLGSLGAAGLGAYASNKQSSAMDNLAQRYEGYGAPYRQKLSDLYKNPSSFLNSDEVQKPVQMGTDALMRSLSTKGNPFGSGNALQQGQSYASDQLFGRLGQEKDRLAGFGGLASYNGAAPQVASNAIGSNANMYNAIGSGLGNIFNPPKSSAQTMAEFMKSTGG